MACIDNVAQYNRKKKRKNKFAKLLSEKNGEAYSKESDSSHNSNQACKGHKILVPFTRPLSGS